ncbi:MAG: ABC transporter permease [Armatimonadetes bacterium]|nr:ABC transporter permease [Armatimonadota bacterium]
MNRANLNNRLFSAALASILIVFLVAVAIILLSNVKYLAQSESPEGAKGLALFLNTLKDSETHFAIKLSVVSALLTTLLSLLIGVPAAYVLSRHRLRGAGFIDTLLDLPIVLPPPVMGISLLVFFNTATGRWLDEHTPIWFVSVSNAFFTFVLGHTIDDSQSWVYSTRGIIVAQFFIACSFGVRAIKASFDTIGTRHEDVARTLGCTRRQAFFRVVLPMARTGIVAGGIMTWARAIAEFGPILFFCGAYQWKTEVMPIAMFLRFSVGRIEDSIALAVIMILISTITLLTFKRLGGKGYLW